ncbi:MAG: hypothetical protein K6G90_06720 [Clostridia bacterium]|nr:hypothetical protein [Clostridia bacterium]
MFILQTPQFTSRTPHSFRHRIKITKTRILVFVLAVICIGYAIYSMVAEHRLSSGITEIALNDNHVQTVQAEVYIIRDETIIPAAEGQRASIVGDGEHVAANETVAYYAADGQSASDILRREELNREMDYYYGLQDTSSVITENPGRYDDTIYSDICEYADLVQTGRLAGLSVLKESLRDDISSRQTAAGEQLDVTKAIAAIEEERRSLGEIGSYTEVRAPGAGYYVSSIDSLEGKYDASKIDEFTAKDLHDALELKPEPDSKTFAGKLITSYKWYFVCELSLKDANGISAGDKKTVIFNGVEASRVQARVERMTKIDGEESYLVVFSCLNMNAEVATLRHEMATITVADHPGLKINSSAVRQETAEDGSTEYYVIIVEGSSRPKRRIRILWYDGDYCIVSGADENGVPYRNGLKLYDTVLVKNRG